MWGDGCQGLYLSFLLQSLHCFYLRITQTHRLHHTHSWDLPTLDCHILRENIFGLIFYWFCDILKWQAHLSLPGRLAGDVVSVPQAVDFALICLRKWNKRFLWDSVPVTAICIYRHHVNLCIHNNPHKHDLSNLHLDYIYSLPTLHSTRCRQSQIEKHVTGTNVGVNSRFNTR